MTRLRAPLRWRGLWYIVPLAAAVLAVSLAVGTAGVMLYYSFWPPEFAGSD